MTTATILSDKEEDAIAFRNAVIYASLQASSGAVAPISIALGGLVGTYLLAADDQAFATAPVTGFNIGVALAALPAAMLMRRVGRRYGFMVGAIIGICGLLLAATAVVMHSFLLFCLALMLNGSANGFAQQYRFAAADRGTPAFRVKAISYVLVGGVVAAVVGPQLVLQTKDLLAPVPFAGAFLAGTGLFVFSLLMLTFLKPSQTATPVATPVPAQQDAGEARPLREIITQRRFVVAVICSTGSYALMSYVMTAAPLAMLYCGFSVEESTLGIQWHVMAMFAPSFFTGSLIARYGKDTIVTVGLLILVACALVGLAGIELMNFWVGLVLLGVGWNFGFIGATAMVTETYRPSEKSKAQGANDFILFGTVAFASLMSGQTLNAFGWEAVNMVIFPVVAICLAALAWNALAERRERAAAQS